MSDQATPSTRREHTPPMPQQLRDQIAAAEAMRTDLDAQNAPPQGADSPPPLATPPQAADGGNGVQPPPVSGDASSTPPAEDDQTWEQRARSLQGRLEQSNRNNTQLSERLNKLDQTLAAMQARGAESPSATPPPAPAKPKLVSEQEAADYGDEFLTVVGKRAREEYSPEFEQLAARLQRIESRVEGVGTVMERNQQGEMWNSLAAQVPNWRAINKSEEFKSWLQQPDLYSGRRRHDLLLEANTRHETDRVVRFFQGFLAEATGLPQTPQASAPSAPPLPNGQAPNGNGSGKPSLADFAAPGRARSGPQDLPPDKPVYTNAWIAKFMADKRTGKYRGREADADAVERDIYQAQHEGRIQ